MALRIKAIFENLQSNFVCRNKIRAEADKINTQLLELARNTYTPAIPDENTDDEFRSVRAGIFLLAEQLKYSHIRTDLIDAICNKLHYYLMLFEDPQHVIFMNELFLQATGLKRADVEYLDANSIFDTEDNPLKSFQNGISTKALLIRENADKMPLRVLMLEKLSKERERPVYVLLMQ